MHSLMHQTQCSVVSHSLLTLDTHQRRGALPLTDPSILCAFPFPSLTNGAFRQSSACPGRGNVSQLRHRHVISLFFSIAPRSARYGRGSDREFPQKEFSGAHDFQSFQLRSSSTSAAIVTSGYLQSNPCRLFFHAANGYGRATSPKAKSNLISPAELDFDAKIGKLPQYGLS